MATVKLLCIVCNITFIVLGNWILYQPNIQNLKRKKHTHTYTNKQTNRQTNIWGTYVTDVSFLRYKDCVTIVTAKKRIQKRGRSSSNQESTSCTSSDSSRIEGDLWHSRHPIVLACSPCIGMHLRQHRFIFWLPLPVGQQLTADYGTSRSDLAVMRSLGSAPSGLRLQATVALN